MDNSQNNVGYLPQMPIFDGKICTEINSDFSLPDYKCEMRRLLATHVTVLAPNEYIGNSDAALDGEVVYKIIYLGADSQVYSATLSDKYSFTVPLEYNSHSASTNDVSLIHICSSDTVNTRVLGPRKLNIRAKLSCRALALSPALYTPANVDTQKNDSEVELRLIQKQSSTVKRCVSEPIHLSDLITTDTNTENIRVIDSISTVHVEECLPSTDHINIKGTVTIKTYYCDESETHRVQVSTRKLPFSHSIYCEGASSASECNAYGIADTEQPTVAESSISIELTLTLCATCQAITPVSLVDDAYSTEYHSQSTYASLMLPKALKCSCGTLTHNDAFSLDDIKLPQDSKIIDVLPRAYVEAISNENGRLVIKGKTEYQIIYFNDQEYLSKEVSAPFKYETDCKFDSTDDSALKWHVEPTAIHSRARNDSDKLHIDTELNFSMLMRTYESVSYLSDLELSEPYEGSHGEIILCYPDKDDTIWSIAKQYGKKTKKLCEKNALKDEADISKKRFLVI